MEPNLSFLASRPVSPLANDPSTPTTAPSAGSASLEKSDFARVLDGQTLKAQRQQLAALEAPGQGLQVVPLGNKINVITSDAPLPDLDSLAQFARMQGLDEAAVQALFGAIPRANAASFVPGKPAAETLSPALPPTDALGLAAGFAMAPAKGLVLPPMASQAESTGSLDDVRALLTRPAAQDLKVQVTALSITQNVPASPAVTPAAWFAPVVALAPPAAPTSASAAGPATAALLPAQVAATPADASAAEPASAALSPALVTAPSPAPIHVSAARPATAVLLPAPVAVAPPSAPADVLLTEPLTVAVAASTTPTSLLPMQPAAWLGKAEAAAADAVEPALAMAPQDAVRLTLAMPAPEITKRLAHMSGNGKETTWAALLASGPASKELPTATDTLTLELPAGFDAELLVPASETGLDQPSDLSTQAGAGAPATAPVNTPGGSPGNHPGNAQAQAEHRAQQFQQLADQMGQAAAQRLMAQIERGQWKMQMRMQPAALGTIHVELDMHSGGLDALFSTDNAVTRDLMTQGSNKLRDTLTQSGMTVASVSVNGEQSRQSGGNSTPGKGRGTPFATPNASVRASATTGPTPAGLAAETDGLNLLA